jgi:hypothetical protein
MTHDALVIDDEHELAGARGDSLEDTATRKVSKIPERKRSG